ncbi:hypothetical protein [Nocardia sp. NPDC052112]|uniref:hypothetical protein n=1 Tax=Nocardia sp. NPDC052112 TaxID=3155646 RepID=UPI00341C1368
MPELPHRAALVGPPRPVRCDVPGEVIAAFRDGLHEWDATLDPVPALSDEIARAHHALGAWSTPERPDGGPSMTPPSGAIQEFLFRSRS